MKRNKAFTLLEVLIVIVIIGILAVIAIPKFINMRTDAINAAAMGNLSALRSAASNYYSNSAAHEELCSPPYRDPEVNAPCFPGNIAQLESLLASPPVWYGTSGGGECYNASNSAITGC